jgi:hypothetical protein
LVWWTVPGAWSGGDDRRPDAADERQDLVVVLMHVGAVLLADGRWS